MDHRDRVADAAGPAESLAAGTSAASSVVPLAPGGPALAAPLAPRERVHLVDALRGLALFGILLVNITYFSQPLAAEFVGVEPFPSVADRATDAVVRFFAETKFYSLFATLFGFGMAVQMGRAQVAGHAFVGRYVRRLLVLLGFAAAHVCLLWFGDILHAYALLAFVLLLFRNCSQGVLLRWAVGLFLVPVVLMSGCVALALVVDAGHPSTPASAPAGDPASAPAGIAPATEDDEFAALMRDLMEREITAYRDGTFAEQFAIRMIDFGISAGILTLIYPQILALFLVGVWLARSGALHDPSGHHAAWRRAAWVGLSVGIPLNVLYVLLYHVATRSQGEAAWFLASPVALLAGPALCCAYVALAARAWTTARGRSILAVLAPAGRMALTNYLAQSLVCTFLFYSFGLGWFGTVRPVVAVWIAPALFGAQLVWSRWWLAHFPFGPAEWLWRSLTYGRPMPMRIRAAEPATSAAP